MNQLRRACGGALASLVVAAGCGAPSPAHRPPPDVEPPAPTSRPAEVSAMGTVQAGVEPGCLLLDSGVQSYLLIGGDRAALEPGERVVVRGVPRPDLVTTCQQGTPLEVSEVRPAP